ncbi:MAG: dihydrodipicolinate synthase family protein, partial [Thermoproteota archaeon]
MVRGVVVPLVTPFRRDLSIDFDAVRWLVRRQAEAGVSGIFPYSTTGEFVHLTPDEGVELTRVVLEEVGGRVQVLPGIGANCTDASVELGLRMRNLGADGVIALPPFFFKPSREGLRLHFSRIAERVDLPVIVYNIPSATGVNIPVDLYAELAEEHSNVVGAKVTYDSVSYLRRLIQTVREVRRDFSVLTGMDDLLLANLALGGDGGIMALANVAPQIHVSVWRAWEEGDLARAVSEFRRL